MGELEEVTEDVDVPPKENPGVDEDNELKEEPKENPEEGEDDALDRKSTRLNSSHYSRSRMPSSA